MQLLERERYLDDLDGLLRQAARGHGAVVFLGGEAGIGKTSLVQAFVERAGPAARVFIGACEPVSTPRPHGPLSDMDALMQGPIGRLVDEAASPVEIARAVLAELAHGPPTVLVIEDAQWIDEAAVDGLRYLGRRIGTVPALAIITFRDDEIGKGHLLRRLLGDLATAPTVHRLHLPPLSLDAIAHLAEGSGFDPADLLRKTNGNPFYLTEVIASGVAEVPSTVRDAVLSRADRLSPDARCVLEAVAEIGSPAESWLVSAVSEAPAVSAEECIDHGLLISRAEALAFRHELAREAVLDQISPLRRMDMHRRILAELRASGESDLSRLAHHAAAAFDREAVLEYGVAAAERAASFRSHREAAAQYDRALRFAKNEPPEFRAHLLKQKAHECFITEQTQEALEAVQAEVAIWRELGNPFALGDALSRESRSMWSLGRNREAAERLHEAIELLEAQPPSCELAAAYSYRAGLHLVSWHSEEAIHWGERALEIAERLGEREVMVRALTNLGSARTAIDPPRGEADLRRSLALAIEAGLDLHAALVYSNLGSSLCYRYAFTEAATVVEEGLAFTLDRGIDTHWSYLLCWKAWILKYQGHWREAAALMQELLADGEHTPSRHLVALMVLGHIYLRQGDKRAMALLDEALALAGPTAEPQRLAPIHAMRAEAAWLQGDLELVRAESRAAYEQVEQTDVRWNIGELAYWRWRAGDLPEPPEETFDPFDLQMRGQWKEAAACWRRLGCPYEAAMALADSEDEAALRYAFAEFARLGAQPMMAKVTRKLRMLGAKTLPRGPRPATRVDPGGLTAREQQVLQLIEAGQTNAQIAAELFVSPRTVAQHVSSILTKLDASSRQDAVERYRAQTSPI